MTSIFTWKNRSVIFARQMPLGSMVRILLIIVIFISDVFLVTSEVTGDVHSCLCSGQVPCYQNLTAAKCASSRVMHRKDCSCCLVCAKQLSESCNDVDLLCDTDFGLTCGEEKKCQPETSCVDDTECSNDRFCFGGACADPCKVLPSVCQENEPSNGICSVRNHRAFCSCPVGQFIPEGKQECIGPAPSGGHQEMEEKPAILCHLNGSMLTIGEKIYRGAECSEECECGPDGKMICKEAGMGTPACGAGFIPMLSVTGEMTEACKILIGKMEFFDGCCVPETCRNVTSQDHPGINNKGRDYKLSHLQNNLREEEDTEAGTEENARNTSDAPVDKLTLSKEMLQITVGDHKVMDEILQEIPLLKDVKAEKSRDEESGAMKVIVYKTTAHSASIKLPLHDKGAILSIALSSQLHEAPTSDGVVDNEKLWKEYMIPPGLPMLTLSDLASNHSYTVKYSVGTKTYSELQFSTPINDTDTHSSEVSGLQNPTQETGNKIPVESISPKADKINENVTELPGAEEEIPNSEETTSESGIKNETEVDSALTTAAAPTAAETPSGGCLFNNTLHVIGAIVYEGCDQRCECLADGEMKCIERCSIPFFKNGTFAGDPLCFEEPSGIDDCCVIVACARNSHAGMARELTHSPCDLVKCGPNADCRYEVSPAGMQSESPNQDTLCVCKDTYVGDPYDTLKGCESVSTSTLVSFPISNPTLPTSIHQEKKTEGCMSNNKTFSYGEEYLDGCSYKCHCEVSGEFLCLPRCHYRHDEDMKIPESCEIQKDASDPECCETLVCAGESTEIKKEKARVSTDGCLYKNRSYDKEEKFYDGCDQQCMCFTNGDVTCQPRCPPIGPSTSLDKDCITLQDPTDSCCNVTVCGNQTVSDVMKEAIEFEKQRLAATSTERARILDDEIEEHTVKNKEDLPSIPLKLSMVLPINSSSILVSIQIPEEYLAKVSEEPILIFFSTNETAPQKAWTEVTYKVKDLFVEGSDELHTIISGLEAEKQYFFQVEVKGRTSNVGSGFTKSIHEKPDEDPDESEEGNDDSGPSSGEVACHYKNKMFAAGEEFYDGCDDYCVCEDGGNVNCSPIECPTEFGLDLLDAHCVKWEPVEAEKEKHPPNCCSQMKCVQNSSCSYQGLTFNNFEEIPEKITGCEKRCYCEYGNVTCQNACPPRSEKPPKNLPCPPEMATVMPFPQNECCTGWVCPSGHQNKTNGTLPLLVPNAPSTIGSLNRTNPPFPPGIRFHPNHHLIHHGIIYDEEDQDQLVPPSTGNQPSVIPLDRLHAHQLQELLHQLSTGKESGNSPHLTGPFAKGQGLYVSVKRPDEIRELERNGAKVVGHSADGSMVLFLPDGHGHPPPFPPHPPNFPHSMLPGSDQFPFGTHLQDTNSGTSHDEITGVIIRALNESTLHIDFTVSPVLVGLQGAVEVSYTNDFVNKPDPAQWEKQLFQQPEDIIDNSHLQLFLAGLKPDSEYHLQIQVIISTIHTSPISDIFLIRTPPPALPPVVKIDPEIKVLETTSRTLEITWRKFTDFESSLIDGVQIKYKAYDDQLYTTSELIHRSIFSYKLTNLQPGKKYEVDLLLVPFTNQTTELKSESAIHVETPPEVDDFSFTIALQSGKIGEQNVELIWEGVPFPEDKFVNIYQVLYQSDNQKEQKSYFKVADRETTKKAVLTELKPGTRYRVWLEAFLTNGKKKRSNVIYVLTKVGSLPSPEKSEQESNLLNSQSPGIPHEATSYYGALVALAIVATFSVIGIIVLLMILIKKQNQSKLPINDRKSESSYDNPSFKNYDMEANGHNNKSSEL